MNEAFREWVRGCLARFNRKPPPHKWQRLWWRNWEQKTAQQNAEISSNGIHPSIDGFYRIQRVQRAPVFPYLSTSWNTFLNGVKTSSGDLLNSNPAPMIHETSRYTMYYVQHSCIRTWCIRDTHYSASTVSKPCYSYVCTYLIECHLGMK